MTSFDTSNRIKDMFSAENNKIMSSKKEINNVPHIDYETFSNIKRKA